MQDVGKARDIEVIAPVTAQVRQPDAVLIALLTGSAPLTQAQWARIRLIEEAAKES